MFAHFINGSMSGLSWVDTTNKNDLEGLNAELSKEDMQ
jgi:hypothetical protein